MREVDLGEPSDNLREHLRGLREWALSETNANPGRALLIAVGLGYVAGGGLFTPLTAPAIRVGLRVALRMLVVPFAEVAAVLACGMYSCADPISDDTPEDRRGTGIGERNPVENPKEKEASS